MGRVWAVVEDVPECPQVGGLGLGCRYTVLGRVAYLMRTGKQKNR